MTDDGNDVMKERYEWYGYKLWSETNSNPLNDNPFVVPNLSMWMIPLHGGIVAASVT